MIEITKFSAKQMELLLTMEKGRITARRQNVYSPFAFYLNIGTLKQYGLAEEDGVGDDNRKFWKLTKRGKRFLELFNEIEEVLRYGKKFVLAAEGK